MLVRLPAGTRLCSCGGLLMVGNAPVDASLPEEDWQALLRLAATARDLGCRPATSTLRAFRTHADALSLALIHPLARGVYAPMIARRTQGPFVLAQVGQSLDGRIATAAGHSHYVNGDAALVHLHRLRALADAVVIGASTAVLDDPQLTTRRVAGPSPVRVVLDPRGRVPSTARMFDAAAPSLALRAAGRAAPAPGGGGAEEVLLPAAHGVFAPADVLAALADRGLHAVLVEGGGETISAFLRGGRLHRLHVLLAPLLIGPGREPFRLPAIERLAQARRFAMTAYPLGSDVLLDCDLAADG